MCCTKPSAPVGGRREAPQQEQRWRLSRRAKPRLRARRRHRTSRVQLCRSCIILAKQAHGETVVSVPAGLRDGPRSDPAGPRDRLEGKKPPNRLWLGTACSALQKPCHGSEAVQHQQAWHVLALPAGSLEYLTALTEIPLCFFFSPSPGSCIRVAPCVLRGLLPAAARGVCLRGGHAAVLLWQLRPRGSVIDAVARPWFGSNQACWPGFGSLCLYRRDSLSGKR